MVDGPECWRDLVCAELQDGVGDANGPDALWGLATQAVEMVSRSMVGWARGVRLAVIHLVKTDLNCCSSLALPRLSFRRWPHSLSGATPELFCLFLFTRFQNGLVLYSPALP